MRVYPFLQAVENANFITLFDQKINCVGADKTGSAGDQDAFYRNSPKSYVKSLIRVCKVL